MFDIFTFILLGGIGVYVLYTFYQNWESETGTLWERLVKAAGDSATKLWAKAQILFAAVSGLAVSGADYFNIPEVSNLVQKVMQPELIPYYLAALAVVTVIARNRTIKS